MKNITATILATAILASFTACGEGNDTPENTTEVTETTTETTTVTTTVTEETTTVTEETTEMTTTETVTEEATLPEFDINSEECLMYRLLDMTVEEIEAEFGELTMYGIIAGGTPCYELADYGIQLYFDTYPDVMTAPLPRDMCPEFVETDGREFDVYPGIYVDMASKEYSDILEITGVSYSMSDFFFGFSSSCVSGDYRITVVWDIPEELSVKVEEAIIWGEEWEEQTAKDELITDMKSGEANVKVKRITISKGD